MMLYRSNILAPDLFPAFAPHVVSDAMPQGRGHDMIRDRDFDPRCGFFTHDEAAILYDVACEVGGFWTDIGARTGWSTAHIAAAGCMVDAVDPGYAGPGNFLARAQENLEQCKLTGRCLFLGMTSEDYWRSGLVGRINGVCIDGCHDSPEPLNDARWALPYLEPTAVVVYHDLWGWPTCDGVAFLREQGFQVRVYDTPNGMAVCWRGTFVPPYHVADIAIDWKPLHRQIERYGFIQEKRDALAVR